MYPSINNTSICAMSVPASSLAKYVNIVREMNAVNKLKMYNWIPCYRKYREYLDQLVEHADDSFELQYQKYSQLSPKTKSVYEKATVARLIERVEFVPYVTFKKNLYKTFDKFLKTVKTSDTFAMDYKSTVGKSGFWIFMHLVKYIEDKYPKFLPAILSTDIYMGFTNSSKGIASYIHSIAGKVRFLYCDDASYSGDQVCKAVADLMPCYYHVDCIIPYVSSTARAYISKKIPHAVMYIAKTMHTVYPKKYTLREYLEDGGSLVVSLKPSDTLNSTSGREYSPMISFTIGTDTRTRNINKTAVVFQHKLADHLSLPTAIIGGYGKFAYDEPFNAWEYKFRPAIKSIPDRYLNKQCGESFFIPYSEFKTPPISRMVKLSTPTSPLTYNDISILSAATVNVLNKSIYPRYKMIVNKGLTVKRLLQQ